MDVELIAHASAYCQVLEIHFARTSHMLSVLIFLGSYQQ